MASGRPARRRAGRQAGAQAGEWAGRRCRRAHLIITRGAHPRLLNTANGEGVEYIKHMTAINNPTPFPPILSPQRTLPTALSQIPPAIKQGNNHR